jgi:tellurite resistance protein
MKPPKLVLGGDQFPPNKGTRRTYYISWWAYLFPSAAVTNATIYVYIETGLSNVYWLFVCQLIALLLLTSVLCWKTIEMTVRGG